MMRQFGLKASAAIGACYYQELIDIFVFDRHDEEGLAGQDVEQHQLDHIIQARPLSAPGATDDDVCRGAT
jgi:hypothetical protein